MRGFYFAAMLFAHLEPRRVAGLTKSSFAPPTWTLDYLHHRCVFHGYILSEDERRAKL